MPCLPEVQSHVSLSPSPLSNVSVLAWCVCFAPEHGEGDRDSEEASQRNPRRDGAFGKVPCLGWGQGIPQRIYFTATRKMPVCARAMLMDACVYVLLQSSSFSPAWKLCVQKHAGKR